MNKKTVSNKPATRKPADPNCQSVTPEQAAIIMDEIVNDCDDESVGKTIMVLRALCYRDDNGRVEMLKTIESRLMIYTEAANAGLDNIVEAQRAKGGTS